MRALDRSVPVLYVDSYDGVDGAAASLDADDVEVAYETDPDRALDLVEADRFECLVLGPEPAGGSGLALLAAVRELGDVPVVLLGDDQPGPVTAFEAGADEYAPRPVDADTAAEVVARVRNVAGRRRAERTASTERARSAALVADEREFRDLAERLDQVVWMRDPDGRYHYVNDTFERVWDVDPDALYADPSLFGARVHPADQPADGFDPGIHEYRVRQADGTVRWLRDHVREVDTDDGPRVVGVAEDVTARQRLAHDLEANVDALGRLYELSSDPELAFETKVERLLETGCDLLGLPAGALTRIEGDSQRTVVAHGLEVEPDGETPLSSAYCQRTIESESLLGIQDAPEEGWVDDPAYETWGFACYLGGKVLVEDELYGTICFGSADPREEPFTAAERSFVELLAEWVSYELTQRAVTDRLRRRNERLDGFASVVSHDLRNPLNVVSGRLEMAREASTEPPVREHLDTAAEGVERMEDLIADLLALARHDGTVAGRERIDVDLGEAARGAWRTVPTGDGTLSVRSGLPEVEAAPARLRQLFENLFRNAVEHGQGETGAREEVEVPPRSTPGPAADAEVSRHPDRQPASDGGHGPAVTVGSLDRPGRGFFVADDGPGLPPDEQVFAPGFTTAEGGTGLGLAIVKQVADAHDWTVRATDAADGGARFEFRF